jgi:methylated-DNA-protein-cysteine methyltransferase-like protein
MLSNKDAIYSALHRIPAGKVTTYGQVAQMANLPGAARLVGNLLRDLPDESRLPWHRVVNAQGRISLPPGSPGHDEQTRRLLAEGIAITRGRIDLSQFGWRG